MYNGEKQDRASGTAGRSETGLCRSHSLKRYWSPTGARSRCVFSAPATIWGFTPWPSIPMRIPIRCSAPRRTRRIWWARRSRLWALIWTSPASSGLPAAGASPPSIPATAFCPRTPILPGRARKTASCSWARPPMCWPRWAISSVPRRSPYSAAYPSSPAAPSRCGTPTTRWKRPSASASPSS